MIHYASVRWEESLIPRATGVGRGGGTLGGNYARTWWENEEKQATQSTVSMQNVCKRWPGWRKSWRRDARGSKSYRAHVQRGTKMLHGPFDNRASHRSTLALPLFPAASVSFPSRNHRVSTHRRSLPFCLFVPLPLPADFIKPVPEGEMTLVHFSNYDRLREDNEWKSTTRAERQIASYSLSQDC